MTSKTTVAFHCDLCGAFLCNGREQDQGRLISAGSIDPKFTKVTIQIVHEQEWHADSLKAQELCVECAEAVVQVMHDLRKRK